MTMNKIDLADAVLHHIENPNRSHDDLISDNLATLNKIEHEVEVYHLANDHTTNKLLDMLNDSLRQHRVHSHMTVTGGHMAIGRQSFTAGELLERELLIELTLSNKHGL